MNFLPKMFLVIHPWPEWMTSLDDNAPAVAVSCTMVLLLAVLAFTMLLMKRRDMTAVQQADEAFLGALQTAPHVLGVFQNQQAFDGSPRWQIYLAACRELCFYLLGTDQVEKNFATRLRAAGRIKPTQMSAVARAMRVASGECILALHALSPGAFLCGLTLPFFGLLGSIVILASMTTRNQSHDPDFLHMMVPAAAPFVLAVVALLILLPLARGLSQQLEAHEARLQLFPLSLANLFERVFVDHRQSMDELPSVIALGEPHSPSLSLPPADQARRTAV